MLTHGLARRLHSDERGIALVVVMAMLMVLGTIAAAVFTNSLQIKQATAGERASKQGYAAALNGLRSATFWLNAAAPADTACPPLPGQTAAQAPDGATGLCGPYESDNISGAAAVTTQPAVNQRYTYWITPTLTSSNDTCTGTTPVVVSAPAGTIVHDRCITAVGQALDGAKVTSTSRVQARVSATNDQFPVMGLWGSSCLSIGVSFPADKKGCETTGNGVSNSDYYGTFGSNGTINAQMKNWFSDPSTVTQTPASLYLGYTSPTSATVAPYTIKIGTLPANSASPTGCTGGSGVFCNGSSPPLPYNTSASGPYQNPAHLLGRYFPPPRVGAAFAQPYPMVLGANQLPTGAGCTTTTDVSTCNNNSLITTASGTPAGCATINASRVLTIADACVVRIPNGTYDFCDISIGGRSAAVLPADQTATAEIRIFVDNQTRIVNGSAACDPSTTTGSFRWNGNGSNVPRWMTNNTATNVQPGPCLTAFAGDPWTALAGQLYVYGAGDPADPTTNYPPNFSTDAFSIPGIIFNGVINAPNSTVNLYQSNTCINGAVTGGALNTAANVGFKWDPAVIKITPLSVLTNFYRTAFSQCTAAGFRFASTSSPPAYPTYPSDGC